MRRRPFAGPNQTQSRQIDARTHLGASPHPTSGVVLWGLRDRRGLGDCAQRAWASFRAILVNGSCAMSVGGVGVSVRRNAARDRAAVSHVLVIS
jgi:hypothetical protein